MSGALVGEIRNAIATWKKPLTCKLLIVDTPKGDLIFQVGLLNDFWIQGASCILEGDYGLLWPNCETDLLIVLQEMSQSFWHFINPTSFLLGPYKFSSPTT